MSLEAKSNELKKLIAEYDLAWTLGRLSALIHYIPRRKAGDELSKLSSPFRQLTYLAGLMVSSDAGANEIQFGREAWERIVTLLREIEVEYDKLIAAQMPAADTEKWKDMLHVAVPSFLTYFNEGPLNYEEQSIRWVLDLFGPLDKVIFTDTGVRTEDFVRFYDNLDGVVQKNFQAHTKRFDLLRPDWESYTEFSMGVDENVSDFVKKHSEEKRPLFTYMSDQGIINRFKPDELVSKDLPIEKVNAILPLLSCARRQSDFLYYTATKPGNPLYEKPIVDVGRGLFQVFDVKQVIHAIELLLEDICKSKSVSAYTDAKGLLLETRVTELFADFLGRDAKIFRGYYVDGFEQDVLILWREYAFIIETKGYFQREPLRDPQLAYPRIKGDFDKSIGYGYRQSRRVEEKFITQVPVRITDAKGNVIEEIDTTQYECDFSIIVTTTSFGVIQTDLSRLLQLPSEDDEYPWAVKLDDLEVFLLTLKAQRKHPYEFVKYLMLREDLHGKPVCSDELEICAAFMLGKLSESDVEKFDTIAIKPDVTAIFDEQYYKGMGFKNEKLLAQKQSGRYLFW